jgi:2-haloacid dehalogenase
VDIDVIVFDIIGTLVDEVGTVTDETTAALGAVGVDAQRSARIAHDWLAGFDAATGRIARGEQEWAPDGEIRRRLLGQLLQADNVELAPGAFDELATVARRLVPWPGAADEVAALAELTTVTGLTNASLDQVAEISARGGLRWHAVLSTALARTYKPDPAAYQLAVNLLNLDPRRSLFVAAHSWDLRAAAAHGFRTAYLPRKYADGPAPHQPIGPPRGRLHYGNEPDPQQGSENTDPTRAKGPFARTPPPAGDFDLHLESLTHLADLLR